MLKRDLYKYVVLDICQFLLSFISSNFCLMLSYYSRGTIMEMVFVILTVGLSYSLVYSLKDISKSVKEYRLSNYV